MVNLNRSIGYLDLAGFRAFFDIALQDELRGKSYELTKKCYDKAACIHEMLAQAGQTAKAADIVNDLAERLRAGLAVENPALAGKVFAVATDLLARISKEGRQECR